MDNYRQYFNLGELISKHINNELQDQEKAALEHWLDESEHNRELFRKLTDEALINEQLAIFSSNDKEKAWQQILKNTGLKNSNTGQAWIRRWVPYAAATFLLLITGIAVNRYFNKRG